MDYILDNGQVKLVVSSLGAMMQSLTADDTEYLWQGDPAYWMGKAPNLFPYIGRASHNACIIEGKEYFMKKHGFARDREFEVVEQSSVSIRLKQCHDDETLTNYPFEFTLIIGYELDGNAVNITYEVVNESSKLMCFGIGGHPGFNVPLDDGLTFEDYYLEFGSEHLPERIGANDECYLNGKNTAYPLKDNKRIDMNHNLFDNDAIVLQNMATSIKLASDKGGKSVTVTYPHMPYLGLWHMPHTDAPYVCIEPWTSLPSREDVIETLEYKTDLVRLEAGKTYTNIWSIKIE